MGRKWIYLDELSFPNKYSNCSGNKFIVCGAKKIHYVETYVVTDEGIKLLDSEQEDVEWEVAYSIECADSEAELDEEAGF